MIPVAVVGVGGYGGGLIEQLSRVGESCGCQLVAAADANLPALPEQAEALRRRGVGLYQDAVEMLRGLRGRCQGVYIASSIPTHTELTVEAARCGYHVNLEKPPAATVQEVDEMLAVVEKHRRICVVGFQAVHSNEIRFIKDGLASGKLGRIQTITCRTGWPRGDSYYSRTDWAGKLRAADRWVLDGPATNALAHQITNLLLLASPHPYHLARCASVRAELYAAAAAEAHDTAAIEMRTDAGLSVHFLATLSPKTQHGPILQVVAERGRAVYNYGGPTEITYADGTSESCPFDPPHGRENMLAEFVKAVHTGDGSHLRCDLSNARQMTLATDGAHESSGRIHRIPPAFCRTENPGTKDQTTVLEGIDELMRAAADRACLFSDLPDAPKWTVATEPFDLAGYARFPQRFRC